MIPYFISGYIFSSRIFFCSLLSFILLWQFVVRLLEMVHISAFMEFLTSTRPVCLMNISIIMFSYFKRTGSGHSLYFHSYSFVKHECLFSLFYRQQHGSFSLRFHLKYQKLKFSEITKSLRQILSLVLPRFPDK